MILKLLCAGLLLAVGMASWDSSHTLSGDASNELAKGIRAELLNSMVEFTNPLVRNALFKDLNEPDDSKRVLTSIDNATAATIFEIFGLQNPKCDKNGDGVVSGDELKCLGKIWKNFVPNG